MIHRPFLCLYIKFSVVHLLHYCLSLTSDHITWYLDRQTKLVRHSEYICRYMTSHSYVTDRACCHCLKSALSSVIHHRGAAQGPVSVPLFSLHWEPLKASWRGGELNAAHLKPRSTTQPPAHSHSTHLGSWPPLPEPACSEQSEQVKDSPRRLHSCTGCRLSPERLLNTVRSDIITVISHVSWEKVQRLQNKFKFLNFTPFCHLFVS